MVVTATYSNSSTASVTNYTISGYDKTKAGNQTITVTYSGKTAVFTVKVIDPNLETVVTPTASPSTGTYNTAQNVTLTTTTEGAKIYYTTNGTNPTEASTEYTSAITIGVTTTIKIIAVKENMSNSDILTAVYTLKVPKPTADSTAGEITKGTEVTLETVIEGAEIWYTANGGTPSKNGAGSSKYTAKITINTATTINAIAIEDGWEDSEILTVAYTIPKAVTPTASKAEGTYTSVQSVTLTTTTESAKIYYTTNETNPTTSSTQYSSAISVGATTTLKAIAVKDGWDDSEILTVVYTIILPFTTAPVLTITADNGSLGYTWTASDPVAESCDVYWKEGSGLDAAAVKSGTKIIGASSGGNITGLKNSTAYSLIITANKTGYTSIDSLVVTKTTQIHAVTPVISVQPQSGSFLKKGTTLSITASVTDGGTLGYQWYSNTSNSAVDGTVIGSANGSSYTTPDDFGTYYYYVIVTNTISDNGDGGTKIAQITSNTANVTINLVIAEWARSVSVGNVYYSRFYAVTKDASDNIYAAGSQVGDMSYTYGTGVSARGTGLADAGGGIGNAVLVKYDANGNALWARSVSTGGSGHYSGFNAVAVDSSGNVYAAGKQRGTNSFTYGTGVSIQSSNSTEETLVLVKYNSNGTAQWARSINTGHLGTFNAVAVDSSGNVYAAGYQSNSSVLVKYNSNGTMQWMRSISTGGSGRFIAVAVDSSDNIYVAGYQNGTSSFTYGTGVSVQGTYNYSNSVLVKYDSNGTAQWACSVSAGNGASGFKAVAVDSSGNIYTAGYQNGTSSFTYGTGVFAQGTYSGTSDYNSNNSVLVKYDSNGTAQWACSVSAGNGASGFNAVAVDSSGSVYAAGYQSSTSSFTYGTGVSAQGAYDGNNVVLVKYYANGTAQWARSVSGGSGDSEFNAVAVDSSGNIYTAGYQKGTSSFTYGTGISVQGSNESIYKNIDYVVLVKYRN